MVEFAPLVERHVLLVVNIRCETGLVVTDDVDELLLDRRSRGFELFEPGEFAALVEFDRGQTRVVVLEGLLPIAPAGAQRHIDERVDASALDRRALAFGVSDARPDVLVELARIGLVDDSAALHRFQRGGVKTFVGRSIGERDAVSERRRHGAPFLFQQGSAHEQRRKITRVERQHLTNCVECAVQILPLPTDRREIEPCGEARLVETYGLEQRGLGRSEIACRHGGQRGLVATGRIPGGGLLINCVARIVPCGQTKARPTFSARLHDAVDTGGRITLGNRALQEALRAEAAIRRLRVTFGNCHIFDVWNFNDRPALIIGMERMRRRRAENSACPILCLTP